jgi:transketolase C-terminal domain/subunit
VVVVVELVAELHDLPFIAPISREVTLSDETIEKIAEKIAEMRSNVTIIAKNKGVAIMGDVSNNEIDTGDIIPDSDRRSE